MTDALARKARNRGAAGDQNDIETIRLQGIGNAAGAGNMADAEKMLHVKKTEGRFSIAVMVSFPTRS